MQTPSNDESSIELAVFDSFSKSVMRNTDRNIASAEQKRENTVVPDEIENFLELRGEFDCYPSEYLVSDGRGHDCLVTIDWLYQAMLQLTQKQKEVLILEYWHGFGIHEIAQMLNISEHSVFQRKRNAFKRIKSYYERNQKNGTRL